MRPIETGEPNSLARTISDCQQISRFPLTSMSENATLDVMTSHAGAGSTGQGSPFFPPQAPATTTPIAPRSLKDRVASVAGLEAAHLAGADKSEIQQVLESLLGALKDLPDAQLQLGERHGDGGLRITSHLAVWLIGKVTDAYGGKLVRLSKVPSRESLRSTSGLAELLNIAISKKQGTGKP